MIPVPCRHAKTVAGCHFCRLFDDSGSGYSRIWSRSPSAMDREGDVVDITRSQCMHLGRVLDGEDCPCPGKLRRCSLHVLCTTGSEKEGVACCASCPDKETDGMMIPSEVTERVSVSDMADILENGPPGPWPPGWHGWGNVQDAHLLLLKRKLENPPTYPQGKFGGRGIVSCVSAKRPIVSGLRTIRFRT